MALRLVSSGGRTLPTIPPPASDNETCKVCTGPKQNGVCLYGCHAATNWIGGRLARSEELTVDQLSPEERVIYDRNRPSNSEVK